MFLAIVAILTVCYNFANMRLLIGLLLLLVACASSAIPDPTSTPQTIPPTEALVAAATAIPDATALPPTESPTAVPTIPPSPTALAMPSEELLKEAVTGWALAIIKGKAALAYIYYSADYQSQCPFDDFAADVFLAQTFLFGDIADREVGYDVTEIKVEDDRYYVSGTFTIDGRPLSLFEDEDTISFYWEWIDGKWWRSTDEANPCPTPEP